MNIQKSITKTADPRAVLYVAFELGNKQWRLAFSDGAKKRQVTILARDMKSLMEEVGKAKKRFELEEEVRVLSCYEAGRDGFWLHRCLLSWGIENHIVDSSSIEVNRRLRRAKSDRLDAGKLLQMLIRYQSGEKVWSVVRVPTVEEEDSRHLHRELGSLKKEGTIHSNRIRSLLIQHVIQTVNPKRCDFLKRLELMRTWDDQPLPPDLKARVVREYERLRLVADQIKSLKKEQEERVKKAGNNALRHIALLRRLYGIGTHSAWVFEMEFFGWREFQNRREVAALAGLTPTPYDSGHSRREQGISKAGNRRIRVLSIETAWGWLRFQPQSKLSRWFNERFALGGKRMRRIGIVALARRLLVDLWRYMEYGTIPEGAHLKPVS